MKSPTARNLKRGHNHAAARPKNRILSRLQILRVEDDERRCVGLRLTRFALAKAAIDAGTHPVKSNVVRSPVLKIPGKGLFVERLGQGNIGGGEFDVVDRVMLRGFAHKSLLCVGMREFHVESRERRREG